MKPDINDKQLQKLRHGGKLSAGLRPFLFKSKAVLEDEDTEEKELVKSLIDAKNEWLDAIASFEHVHEESLVDYYTYKMKACEARYSYFIKEVKERGYKLPIIRDMDNI